VTLRIAILYRIILLPDCQGTSDNNSVAHGKVIKMRCAVRLGRGSWIEKSFKRQAVDGWGEHGLERGSNMPDEKTEKLSTLQLKNQEMRVGE